MKTKLCLFALLLLSATINSAVAPVPQIVHDVAGNQIKANMLANQIAETQERLADLTKISNFMKNSKEYHETVKLMESTICSFEGLEFYFKEINLLNINNCFFDFELQAISVRIKNAAWVVTTAMLAWEKSSTLDRSKNVSVALSEFDAAHKDLMSMKKEMSETIVETKLLRKNAVDGLMFISLF